MVSSFTGFATCRARRPGPRSPLSLILGGAIGNLIDRLYLGKVIDYIQVWLGSYPWPAFNIADAAISVGIVLLIVSSFVSKPVQDGEAET